MNTARIHNRQSARGVIAIAMVAVAAVASAQGIRTTVDGLEVNFNDVQPMMINGRVMVPVRGVFEHMNATVLWDANTRTVIANRGNDNIRLPINSYTATVNSRQVTLDAPATIIAGRTIVPLRFLSESLGAEVEWIEASRTVAINTAGGLSAQTSTHNGQTSVHNDQTSVHNTRMLQDDMNPKQHELYTSMRKVWEDHVAWTRLFIVSAANDLPNKSAATARLMKNQVDIGDAIKPLYGESAGDRLTDLLKEHISIAGAIIAAAKSDNSRRVAEQKQVWYRNSDEIADLLSDANPHNWPRQEMREMMRDHLDLTFDEATAELNGDYSTSVRRYDQVRTQILAMSDMLSEGIVRQFPNQYSSGPVGPPPFESGYRSMMIESGTVIPFKLNQRLSSVDSLVGDRFTANVDTMGAQNYSGLPSGSVLEGHVDVVREKSGSTPGVIGLAFDRVRLANGQVYAIRGALSGLDSDSVENRDGRLVAKSAAKNDNLKYVGYGAGAGALVAILTNGNIITNSLIGGALGFLFGELQKDPNKAKNVTLDTGSRFGVRLTDDFSFRVPDRN